MFGGERVDKDSSRLDAYGTIDELNAVIGYAIAINGELDQLKFLENVQRNLFVIGSDLATPLVGAPSTSGSSIARLGPEPTQAMEHEIDRIAGLLPELKSFILPGGTPGSAALHMARCVCRRAERAIVTLDRLEPTNPQILGYVNRLSDYLFMLARLVNYYAGVADVVWSRRSGEGEDSHPL